MKSKVYYTIKKTFLKTNQSVLMNNSLGEVLELNDAKTVKLMVETLNSKLAERS